MAFNSRIEYSGTTGTTFSYAALDLLTDTLVSEQSQLVVTKNGTELAYASGAPGAAEYTLNKTTRVMTLGTALVSTDVLLIRRSTKRDGLHVVFTNNSPIAEDDLNLVLEQLLFIAQEAQELQEVQRTFSLGGMIQGFRNQTYVLEQKAPFTYDISEFVTKLTSGTCTVKLQIDGVDVTGSSHAANSAESSQTGMSANRVLTGQTLQMVVTGSSIEDTFNLSFTVKCSEV
jgi:hypothetical protein